VLITICTFCKRLCLCAGGAERGGGGGGYQAGLRGAFGWGIQRGETGARGRIPHSFPLYQSPAISALQMRRARFPISTISIYMFTSPVEVSRSIAGYSRCNNICQIFLLEIQQSNRGCCHSTAQIHSLCKSAFQRVRKNGAPCVATK
jgi:hypothetical protein